LRDNITDLVGKESWTNDWSRSMTSIASPPFGAEAWRYLLRRHGRQ
jgi:hypothetical protein